MVTRHFTRGVILLAMLFTVALVARAGSAPTGSVVAYGGYYETQSGQMVTVNPPGVLQYDTDSLGLPLSAKLVTTTPNGSLYFPGDGSFSYTSMSATPARTASPTRLKMTKGTSPTSPPSTSKSTPRCWRMIAVTGPRSPRNWSCHLRVCLPMRAAFPAANRSS